MDPLFVRIAARYQKKKTLDTGTVVYEYTKRQVQLRNRQKARRLERLRSNIKNLQSQVKKDLASDDPEKKLTALAIGLIDATYERVGNDDSAKEGHFGVTGWTRKQVKFSGNKATISYVGKSGVKQSKAVTDAQLVSALKDACEGAEGEDGPIFGGAVRIDAPKVNRYLKKFSITAKDLRGYHANVEMKERLKRIRAEGPELPYGRKEKDAILKAEFKKALEETAKAVGHEASTLRSQYLVPDIEPDFMADGQVDGKMTKKAATYEITPAFINKLRKDFLTLIGNIKRIKTDRDQDMVRKGFQAWRKHFSKVIFENWLNNKDVKGESWGYAVRKPAWDFYLELSLPEDPNQWRNWEKRVRRKGQIVWKELKEVAARWERQRKMELEYGLEGESLTLPPRGEAPSEERVTLEGFLVILVGLQPRTGDTEGSYEDRRQALERFKAVLSQYKRQAARHFPLLLKVKIPIYFDYTMGLGKGGDYDLYEGNKLRVNAWSTVPSEKGATWTLAHEMGHHIWKTYLGGEAQKLWEAMISGTTDLDLAKLMQDWPPEWKFTSDFVKNMAGKDSLYALRVDVASGWEDSSSLWKRENFQELLDSGTRSVKVPAIPISAYAGKNKEEAFCEAIGLLVSKGPRAIHPKVRWVLSLMFPGQIRMAAVVLARYLEARRG